MLTLFKIRGVKTAILLFLYSPFIALFFVSKKLTFRDTMNLYDKLGKENTKTDGRTGETISFAWVSNVSNYTLAKTLVKD